MNLFYLMTINSFYGRKQNFETLTIKNVKIFWMKTHCGIHEFQLPDSSIIGLVTNDKVLLLIAIYFKKINIKIKTHKY